MVDVEKIRKSLILQLQYKKADVEFLREQIDSYCRFAALEDKMWEDIEKNGKTIKLNSSVGKVAERENPAVKMAVMCSKQKIDILKRLGLTIDSTISNEKIDGEDTDI